LALQKGNALLREFYLERYREIHGDRGSFRSSVVGGGGGNSFRTDPIAERFVDWNVEQFLLRVEESMNSLKTRFADLESTRREALSHSQRMSSSDRQRLRAVAGELANDASKLLRMVSMVIWNVKTDRSVATEVSPSSDFLAAELSFLRTQVEKAEESLNDLFLEPSHTVTVGELRGDNVLSQLKSIEVMSKQIIKKL
jgi:hypothetical protein